MARRPLPAALQTALAAYANRFASGQVDGRLLAELLGELTKLPLEHAAQAGRAIANEARLWASRPIAISQGASWLHNMLGRRAPRLPSEREMLATLPGIELLLLFHYNGYVREAALDHIHAPLPSAFYAVAVAERANDWVPEIRAAALRCAARSFPRTAHEALAEAALHLLSRMADFARWGPAETEALWSAFGRADVAAAMAARFRTTDEGLGTEALRQALRWPAMDRHLESLARHAVAPQLRALALAALAEGRTRWRDGVTRAWIDKSMGQFRWVPRFAERPVAAMAGLAELLAAGAADRAAIVRRTTADLLIRRSPLPHDLLQIARRLSADRNRRVRERASFLMRQHAGAD